MLHRLAAVLVLALALLLPAQAAEKRILVFGDSLSAGFGIAVAQSWPALLGERLRAAGAPFSVANASISGETTAGGRARLGAALEQFHPALVILALGANDGLRGLPLGQMKDNLGAMIDAAQAAGARVLLVGMRLPPNYGPYALQFQAAFRDIARERRVPLVDFLLAGVAEKPELFQADMLHPTAEAQGKILDNVWPGLVPLLK